MPPCRTAVVIRAASIPDSFATIASASSDALRCSASKSAGTYSASITGVIGCTLSRRTWPFQVCDSVAAVAMAGFARSVSARSIGTSIDLNIRASRVLASIVQRLLQQSRAGEAHEVAAAERDLVPIVDRKIQDDQSAGRQIVLECFPGRGVAVAGEHQCQLVHAGIVADQHQARGVG